MALTAAQLTSFKTAINADAAIGADVAAGNHSNIADYYNANHATRLVWKDKIMVRELNTAIDWTAFALLTAQKQNCYLAMTQGGFVDGTAANVRAGFSSIFGNGATLTALTALAQRIATRFEALADFWTTSGGNSGVSSVLGTVVTAPDVAAALSS